jgi:hypothetical protein
MNNRRIIGMIIFLLAVARVVLADTPVYPTDPEYMVNGEYRGRFTPDADYVLSGKFREDLGPLPEVPYEYVSDEAGYDPTALSPVPPVGVHPRVLMSPEDIVRIRAEVAKGDQAHPWFRIVWNDIKNAKPMDQYHGLTSGALVALIEQDHDLGRQLVDLLMEEARYGEPMIEILNTHPSMAGVRDNWYYYRGCSIDKVGGVPYREAFDQGGAERIAELAKESIAFGDSGLSSGGLFNSVLSAYDYLYDFMTEEERAYVRQVIAKATVGRYTTGMELPGNWFINNHMSMGEDLLILHLAIEGEEGYDPRLLRTYSEAIRDALTYMISPAGHLHEKCKGFMPERAPVAIARRADQPETGALPVLRHSHLKAMVWAKVMDAINVFYSVMAPELGKLEAADRHWWMGYGSGPWMDQFFNWAFVLKHVYPEDPAVDFFYKERLKQHGFGSPHPEADSALPRPRIRYTWRELMLLTVTPGLLNEQGEPIDYDLDGLPPEITDRMSAYVDLPRGVAMSRSSWDPDAMQVHYEARSDVFMTGHETPEAGDFNLSSHGVIWSMRREWYMDSYFRNMILIDGKAGLYPNAPAHLMKVDDNQHATTFVSDNTHQYNWWQGGKNFYLWHGAYEDAPRHMNEWKSHSELMTRRTEPAFLPHMRAFQDGLAGLDWGAWHGESRGPAVYHQLNDVDHVFRTLHMTKGAHPYVLIVDDVRKDDQVHQYDWCLHLERDIVLAEADSAVRNRYTPQWYQNVENRNATDLLLTLKDVPETRYWRYGVKSHRKARKGDPMLLVRVLWRNADWPYPQPVFEEGAGGNGLESRIRIPALAVNPEFRVLLFPHRFGDPLPLTDWNDDRTRLTVQVGGHTDVYSFDQTDRERTVLTMERDGQLMARSNERPSMPVLDTPHEWTPDRNAPDTPRTLVIGEGDTVALHMPPPGQLIRYTLDESDPTDQSDLYTAPIEVEETATLKARAFARHWPYGNDNGSDVLEVDIQIRSLVPSRQTEIQKRLPGLICEVFEKHHTWFDEKTGIFTGTKSMLPAFEDGDRRLLARLEELRVPSVRAGLPAVEMAKGYYRYRGFLDVPESGIYGFRVYSCGPVELKIGEAAEVIHVTGTYGLSLGDRYGQAALQAGLHSFELLVCDPSFWKQGREGPYPLDVAWLPPGQVDYQPVPTDRWTTAQAEVPLYREPDNPVATAVDPGAAVPGLMLHAYDRTGVLDVIPDDGIPVALMQTREGEAPYRSKPVLSLDGSARSGQLLDYTGWLVVDVPGLYSFQTDNKGANQLWVGGVLVAQSRVDGPSAAPGIRLDAGYHPFSFRLAGSKPVLLLKRPGQKDFVPAKIGMFARPAGAEARDDGRLVLHLDGESLENLANTPTRVSLQGGGSVDDGHTGRGIKLGGDDSWMEVTGLQTPEDALTLAFWIRIDKPMDRGLLESTWGSEPGGRLRGYNLQVGYYRDASAASYDLRQVGADKGAWCHVVISYGDTVRLFVNGALRDEQIKGASDKHAYKKGAVLFKGQAVTIDDLLVYNRTFQAADVAALYRQDDE